MGLRNPRVFCSNSVQNLPPEGARSAHEERDRHEMLGIWQRPGGGDGGISRTQQCLPFISGGNSRSTVRRGPSSVEGGGRRVLGGRRGTWFFPSLGRDCFAFREAMSYWLEGPCSGCSALYPLTFPVCEEAVYSQRVIYSLIRSTSLLKRIFTSCPGEEAKGKIPALGNPIVSVRDYRKRTVQQPLSPKWGN